MSWWKRLSPEARESLERLAPTLMPEPEPEPEPEPVHTEPAESTLPEATPQPENRAQFDRDPETLKPVLRPTPFDQVQEHIQQLRSRGPQPVPTERPVRHLVPEEPKRQVVGATHAERVGDYGNRMLNDQHFRRIIGITEAEVYAMHVDTETRRREKRKAEYEWLSTQWQLEDLQVVAESVAEPDMVNEFGEAYVSPERRKRHAQKVRSAKQQLLSILGPKRYEMPETGIPKKTRTSNATQHVAGHRDGDDDNYPAAVLDEDGHVIG